MTHRQIRFVLAGAVVLLALLVALFFVFFERAEEEIEVGYQGPARLNPYLAAERLLNRLGVPARSSFGDWMLPPPAQTLLLLNPHRSMSQQEGDEILAWVEKGSSLVAVLPDAPSLDPLLAHFEVTAVEDGGEEEEDEGDEKSEKKDGKNQKDEAEAESSLGPEVLEVSLSGSPALKVSVPRWPRLMEGGQAAQAPETRVASSTGAFLLRYRHGQGLVTILSDASFLRNGQIGQLQHADLAYRLALGPGGQGTGALVVAREDVPTLARLLARHAWAALLSGGILLVAWLRLAGSRFGPVLPDPPRDRRSLLEHVEASGDFLWHSGKAEELVQSTRQALLRRIELRQPTWSKLPSRELIRRLGSVAGPGLALPDIDRALHGPVAADTAAFLSTIQTLETLRRSL